MEKSYYEFKYVSESSSTNPPIEVSIRISTQEITWIQLKEYFNNFIKGCGFYPEDECEDQYELNSTYNSQQYVELSGDELCNSQNSADNSKKKSKNPTKKA
jgi:hypothetical protein